VLYEVAGTVTAMKVRTIRTLADFRFHAVRPEDSADDMAKVKRLLADRELEP